MRSIYLLELNLLQYRDRKEIEPALTRQQKETLNRFLNEYSESLLHIAAITEHGPQAPRSSSDDSAGARLASSPRQRLTIFAGGPRYRRADGRFAKLAQGYLYFLLIAHWRISINTLW